MAKILLTGMTSAHVSKLLNSRSKNFMGVIADVLEQEGHEVVWRKSSPIESAHAYDEFDSVIVGITPIGSLAANYAYGALNVIDRLWSSPKLTLVVDAPNASQIEPNLRQIQSNPQSFVKPFFSARSGYRDVIESGSDLARLLSVVDRLLSSDWPKTIFPRLPWKLVTDIKLPPNAKTNLHGINLDSYLLEGVSVEAPEVRASKWVTDNHKAKWVDSVSKTLALPTVGMKLSKSANDEEVFSQVKRATGALIAPDYRDGTWWTYRLVQCLLANTPIATDWKESEALGGPWNMLASTIESLGEQQRHLLSLAQKEIYLANIDSKAVAKRKLEQILWIG